MYLWRKLAEPRWLRARENMLQARSRGGLAIVSRPGHKRLQLEIACRLRNDSQKLVEEFGGHAKKWPGDWLKRFTDAENSKLLKIGKRVLIARSSNSARSQCCSVQSHQRIPARGASPHALRTAHTTARIKDTRFLVIPASRAFGTGEHATTAMSLRLLEQLTRQWKNGWSLADLGTGSGILALAAKRFGASRVLAVDADPIAISTAKANARRNRIGGVDFQLGDLRHWKPPRNTDVITANLFSGLLMRLLPKLRRSGWLILSGVLRTEQQEFVRALRPNQIEVVKLRRRGKWIAILARNRGEVCTTGEEKNFAAFVDRR
jgi:ribosomal protein L11 methyltransferase